MLALEMADFWLSGQWHSGSATVTPVITGSQILPPANATVQIVAGQLRRLGHADRIPARIRRRTKPSCPLRPDDVRITEIPSYAMQRLPNWAAVADTMNIYLSKQSATGSGASPALKVTAGTPHSIVH